MKSFGSVKTKAHIKMTTQISILMDGVLKPFGNQKGKQDFDREILPCKTEQILVLLLLKLRGTKA